MNRRQSPDPVDACDAATHLPHPLAILSLFFFVVPVPGGDGGGGGSGELLLVLLILLVVLVIIVLHVCNGCICKGSWTAALSDQRGQCMQLLVSPVRAGQHDLAAEDALIQGRQQLTTLLLMLRQLLHLSRWRNKWQRRRFQLLQSATAIALACAVAYLS